MTKKAYLLAHDLGTTGDKATLFDTRGDVVAKTLKRYGTSYPQAHWAEQDPHDWRAAMFETTQRLMRQSAVAPAQVAAVSFSGQMQGAVFVDREGRVLRSAIIWADQRATEQVDRMAALCAKDSVYQRTGHRLSAAYTAAKVLWVKEHQPHIFARTYKVLQAKDYAAFLLTGVFATDYSDASGTQLFNLERRCWDEDLLQRWGLAPELFPEAHPATRVIGRLTRSAASASGLLEGTPVVVGGGDGACAAVGAGSVREGDAYTYIGSSAWIALTTQRPILDPQQRTFTFAHLDPKRYMPIGTMQSAGSARDWALKMVQASDERAEALVAHVPAGSGGLLFLPYLLGERSPYWNPRARGAFVGLSITHGRGHLVRAVLEGVALNLKLILDLLLHQGVEANSMRLIGGGAQSALWRQIVADVYQRPLLRPGLETEATALGAAIAGGIGVGVFKDFSVVDTLIPLSEAERPNPAHRERYAALYALFQESYQRLEPLYERLSAWAQKTEHAR